MSPTPDHLDDEILSALLDGPAGAAPGPGAGGPEAGAAAHLGACERCAGRQAELAAARAAIASAAVEPLDELARRRLLAGALGAFGEAAAVPAAGAERGARSRWFHRHPALIGSAAAVIVALLVGVPFVMGDNGPGGSDASLSGPTALEAAGSFLGDLGDLRDREQLRLRLSGAGAGDALGYSAPGEPGPSPAGGAGSPAPAALPTPESENLTDSGGARSATPPGPDGASATDDSAETWTADRESQRDRADSDACVAALLNGPAGGGRLLAAGTGTFDGRAAVVAAFELSGGRVAFVADRSGCAVLDRFSL